MSILLWNQSGSLSQAALAGLFAGMALGTKYTGGVLILCGMAFIFTSRAVPSASRFKAALCFIFAALLVFPVVDQEHLGDWQPNISSGLRRRGDDSDAAFPLSGRAALGELVGCVVPAIQADFSGGRRRSRLQRIDWSLTAGSCACSRVGLESQRSKRTRNNPAGCDREHIRTDGVDGCGPVLFLSASGAAVYRALSSLCCACCSRVRRSCAFPPQRQCGSE